MTICLGGRRWSVLASSFMSSDTYHIHVTEIDGDKVEFLCSTGTAAGLNDYAATRSFALMLLEDGMPYVSDGKGTPLQAELRRITGEATPRIWDKEFNKEHVAKFITKATLVQRIGIIKNEAAWRRGRFDEENEVDYPLHRFVLTAQVTDPKWLIGLEINSRYGTTAFDAWWDDPTRQSSRELTAIERKATKWKPPAKKRATKNDGAETATKPAAAKKTAAKKSTKKSAEKTKAE